MRCLQYVSAALQPLISPAKEFHTSINGLKRSEVLEQDITMKPTGILKRLLEILASKHNRHMQAVVDSQTCTGEYFRQDLGAVLSNLAHEVREHRTLNLIICLVSLTAPLGFRSSVATPFLANSA